MGAASKKEAPNRILEFYYSEEEVARALGVTVKALRNRHTRGEAPPKTDGGLYPKDLFHAWMKRRAS